MTDLSQEQPQEENYQVGRTSATERDAITSEKFFFWLTPGVIVNPFDIMSVGQINQPNQPKSRTYGLVTALEHRTDAHGHLDNYISSNFGQLAEEPNTVRQGTTVATASVLSNNQDVYMPVPSDQIVQFAQPEEVQQALGMDGVAKERPEDLIPAGLIKMTNGVSTPIYLDRQFVLGPEGGHVNISGISGLATKTSYAMFLLQSILQTASDSSKIAVILLNVKQADLLQIDKPDVTLSDEQKALWRKIGLEPKPFENVYYFLPRNKSGRANSFSPIPKNYTLYAYDLEGTTDKLDLLFSNASDPSGTIEGIGNEISAGIRNQEPDFRNIYGWDALYKFIKDQTRPWRNFQTASLRMYCRHLNRLVRTGQTGIFPESRNGNEKLLGEELANIKGGSTYVVDIAKLANDEQTLVFGDILKTIYEVKDGTSEARTTRAPIPDKVIVFVDELNKYAPSGGKESPITRQVLEVAERGRSLGVILISAQQFMSAVHPRVTGNSATKIIGRTGSSEVNAPDYRFLDQDIRSAVTRLVKGDLLISHAIYRQPVKVTFPRAAYKQQQTEDTDEGEF